MSSPWTWRGPSISQASASLPVCGWPSRVPGLLHLRGRLVPAGVLILAFFFKRKWGGDQSGSRVRSVTLATRADYPLGVSGISWMGAS